MAPPTSNKDVPTPVPFPQPESASPPPQGTATSSPTAQTPKAKRSRTSTNTSSTMSTRIRTASLKFIEATPPPGMWAATGSVSSRAPSLADIRTGSYSSSGWSEEPQRYNAEMRESNGGEGGRWLQRRTSNNQSGSEQESAARPGMGRHTTTASSGRLKTLGTEPFPALTEEDMNAFPPPDDSPYGETSQPPSYTDPEKEALKAESEIGEKSTKSKQERPGVGQRQYSNGYEPPPKLPWTTSMAIALKAFSKWVITPWGFLITLYGLNVVAWGGMLFLLLCNAAPAMCNPDCDDIQSPRRIWIEIDSQILNALFCVTGFGLAPWRFRDLYWWAVWRIGRQQKGIRRLAGIHRGWFRLPGSQDLPKTASSTTVDPEDPAVPIPHASMPDPPPTGRHAPPTKSWKMDFVVWMNVWNTFFQVVLCFYMWNYNRFDRPSWATGLFVALASIVAGLGGITMFIDGKAVKRVEGVPMPEGGYAKQQTDAEV